MDKSKPNLFGFASSELSQDAFICWLLSWVKGCYRDIDSSLHKTAIYFLDQLFKAYGKEKPNRYDSVEIKKQDHNIDVLVVVNDSYAIIIEDKTNTSDHFEKLQEYYDQIANMDFRRENLIPIYFKTGDQSDFSEIEKAGYVHFSRRDFLSVLEHGYDLGVRNAIFIDYYDYLQNIESAVSSYKVLPIKNWYWNSWVGFYKELQEVLGQGNWDYVPNPSGGFLGFWWHSHHGDECSEYLQLEQERLCFKIEVEGKSLRSTLRNHWSKTIIRESEKFDLNVVKPSRFGNGTWMTVAVLQEDYRQADKDGRLSMQLTIALLKRAQELLDYAVETGMPEQ